MDIVNRHHLVTNTPEAGTDTGTRFDSLERGTIVTYVDLDHEPTPFRRAVATGGFIHDPRTDLGWLPVRRPDHVGVLVDPADLVDLMPRVSGHE
jgi:hypothetical protein